MGFFDDIGSAVNSAAKAVGSVVNNPVVQGTAAGMALVFPPVGIPVASAVAGAAVVSKALDSAIPDKVAQAKKLMVNTALASKDGNMGARIALQTVAIVKRARPPKLGGAISRSRVAWLKRKSGSVRNAWARKQPLRVRKEFNRLFPARPPTLKAGPKAKSPNAQLAAAEKRGEMRASLRAVQAMRDAQLSGIMMGEKQIAYGEFAPVP